MTIRERHITGSKFPTEFSCVRIKRQLPEAVLMAARGRTRKSKVTPDEEARLSRIMFAEYREENAKDLEREGIGNW